MKTAFLFQKENSKVRCLACCHQCLIPNGKRGLCGVRENQKGELQLLVYGKVIAKHTNPLEKKPLYHFLPGESVYSIGTVGCNFKCGFCQNWQLSQERAILGQKLMPQDIKQEMGTLPAIAYTYNEPTIFFEYAYDTANLLPQKKHIFVTNGYYSKEALEKMDFIDAVNIDLKSFNQEFYRKNCGAKLKPVLENIKNTYKKKIWLEISTLLIPGENDSEEEIRKIAQFIARIDKEIPWHISGFHADYKMLDKRSATFPDLLKALNIAKEEGLSYVYLGNILSVEHNSTYCPKCKAMLIKRENYQITVAGLEKGKCKYCGYEIKGVWK